MTRAVGLTDAPAWMALSFSQEVAAESGLSLEEAGDYLLSQEGQAKLAKLAALEPGWLPLLRRLRAQLPGPTSREPFVTKMAELIGVWHDFSSKQDGNVPFDVELAVELGLMESAPAEPHGKSAQTLEEGWAAGAYLFTEVLTPMRPRTIEFMPEGVADSPSATPWTVRLRWATSEDADIERTECFPVTAIPAWGYVSIMTSN